MTPCKIDGCEKARSKRGWCDMHYNRWIRHGDPGEAAPRPRTPAPIDITTRYEVRPTGCWEWTGHKDEKGYGTLTRQGKRWSAHRFMYTLHRGSIPEGLEIDHLCRNTSCVNPDHLEPVTRRENLARSTHPSRFGILFNTCMRGHEFTPENTYIPPSRPKGRTCRACAKERSRQRWIRVRKTGTPAASNADVP